MKHNILCCKRTVLAWILVNLALALSVNATINVQILPSSTNTQLDIRVTGTITANDFGTGWANPNEAIAFYIYRPDLDWLQASMTNFVNNVDGTNLTAPSILAASGGFLTDRNFTTPPNSSQAQDAIAITWGTGSGVVKSDFEVGQELDWSFSMRNFNQPPINLNLFRTSDIPIETQFGLGAPIPEPSTYALIFGALGLGYVLIRRRRVSK